MCILFMCLYGYILSIDEWMNGDEIHQHTNMEQSHADRVNKR